MENALRQTGSCIILFCLSVLFTTDHDGMLARSLALENLHAPKDQKTHTQESNEPRVEMTNWSWKINEFHHIISSLHLKLETTIIFIFNPRRPMKTSFFCGFQVIQQVQDNSLQGIGGLKELFHGATSDYLFFLHENARKQKQDT